MRSRHEADFGYNVIGRKGPLSYELSVAGPVVRARCALRNRWLIHGALFENRGVTICGRTADSNVAPGPAHPLRRMGVTWRMV